MSSKLLGMIRAIRVGPRLANHKLALYALADDGKAVGMVSITIEDLMDAAPIGERQALKMRLAWERMGLISLKHGADMDLVMSTRIRSTSPCSSACHLETSTTTASGID